MLCTAERWSELHGAGKSEDPTTPLSVRRLGKHSDKLLSAWQQTRHRPAQLATNPSM